LWAELELSASIFDRSSTCPGRVAQRRVDVILDEVSRSSAASRRSQIHQWPETAAWKSRANV
jgi:hypothetical protein